MAETDPKATIDQVAELMEEFRLSEARLQLGDFGVVFRRRPSPKTVPAPGLTDADEPISDAWPSFPSTPEPPPAPRGTPVVSPMNGIYYGAPNPGSPPFVRPGEPVSPGQIIGLIEAMKVFNEIPCPIGGMVVAVVAQTADIVNPGDVLLYVDVDG